MSRSDCWVRTTCAPRRASARAAETPRRPPPMTTARVPSVTASDSARQSSIVRNAWTPPGSSVASGANRPRSGGSTGFEPVARTRVSYATSSPFSHWTSRRSRSIRTARVRRCGTVARGSSMTSGAYVPASTSASSTRLYGACASSPISMARSPRRWAIRVPARPVPMTTTRPGPVVASSCSYGAVMYRSVRGGCFSVASPSFPTRNAALSGGGWRCEGSVRARRRVCEGPGEGRSPSMA